MAAAGVSRSGPTSEALEDYSLYSHLNDDELLQIAIQRSLTDMQNNSGVSAGGQQSRWADRSNATQTQQQQQQQQLQPRHSSGNAPPLADTNFNSAPAEYSSPNPPAEKPPDPKTFEGSVSYFVTGSGKRMVAYRKPDGTLLYILPEPEQEQEPLFQAIRDGQVSKVKALATQPGTNLMLPSHPGWLAVHQAAWYGQEACLKVLLSAQPGMVNKRTESGETALMLAISKDHLGCVQVLLENGADPDVPNRHKETPLFRACEINNASLVAALLNHGAAVNTHCLLGWTALQEAMCRDNVEIGEMLLKAGAKLNLTNVYGISPLFTAAQSGQLAALRFLIKHGADINSQAADGATALYEATKNGHEAVVELLLSQKADANKPGKTGLLPLHIAAQTGNDIIVSMLMDATSRARVRRAGISPLHLAAERNRDEVLEMLVEAGLDVNAQLSEERSQLYEDRRTTPLYFAVINNNVHAVRLLLAAGADPNLDLFRPLMVAARQGCSQTVRLLVEHGADVNALIPTHPTTFPAVYMFSMKYLPLFKYLLDHGGHALPCFHCVYGPRPHPPINTSRSQRSNSEHNQEATLQTLGVQFCEMISAPSIIRWAGPIIDLLLDYVGHVTLCSRLLEHLDSYEGWSTIKERAAAPPSLQQLCRLHILQRAGCRRVGRLPLPGRLVRFLQHREREVEDVEEF